MKFSTCINKLTELWIHWILNDRICRDNKKSSKIRRKAGEKCELLIKRRYELIDIIDSYF